MIGVMYLVLTALLALQVSSSVLDKFALLDKSLEQSFSLQMRENAKKLAQIQAIVKETGSRKADTKVLNTALDIARETKKTVGYVNDLKSKLVARTGGISEKTGYPKGLKDDRVVASMMIDKGKGLELQKKLNGYVQYLSQATDEKYAPIALDAKDIDLFTNNPNQASKDFTV